ncbi:MAG: hypothetical protein ABIQ32_00245 [Sphingomicrobium sp.]
MKGANRSTGHLGCAAVISAMIALPVGYVLGRHSPQSSAERTTEITSTKNEKMRNMFSPNPLSDPPVKDQHRLIVEGLELACVQKRLHCEDAASARRWLERGDKR